MSHVADSLAAPLAIGRARPRVAARRANPRLKRLFDLLSSAALLLIAAPLMGALALLIKLDSPGPVLFVQTRRGRGGRLFRILKFRTMTALESGRNVAQAKARDGRVTRMGRWMRRANLDELPQLLNVLRGEMSLVGPRPHAIPHDRLFAREIEGWTRRAAVPPGMTGWAQVHGLRGAVESPEHLRRRVEHDLYYIENASLALDLLILARTLFSPAAYRNAF
jgi:lipopolysaccharide/colanic/teichoic acid biosynthesis glycosyltransferase